MAFDSIFPFLPNTAGSPPQLFPFDVVINTAFPGVEFIGTEPNQEYQEIREVNGSLWLVTNAMFNQNLLQWDQEVNQNTTLPAYALELAGDGSMTRFESPPTLIPDTPITWTPLWTVTGIGIMDSTPLEVTSVSPPMNDLAVTWDPGLGVVLVAREVDITDIASSPNSLLDNLVVNGVPVWSVNKAGLLTHGTVPASAVIGIFNNPTFTGTSTFSGPAFFNGPATFNSSITGNSTLFMVGLTTLNGHANINSGLTVTGGENVTGGLTTDTLTVTGTTTFNGPVVFSNTSDLGVFTSNSGSVNFTGTNTLSLVMPTVPGTYNIILTLSVSFDTPQTVSFSDTGQGSWNYMNQGAQTSVFENPGGGGTTITMSGTATGSSTASIQFTYSGTPSAAQPNTSFMFTAAPAS